MNRSRLKTTLTGAQPKIGIQRGDDEILSGGLFDQRAYPDETLEAIKVTTTGLTTMLNRSGRGTLGLEGDPRAEE